MREDTFNQLTFKAGRLLVQGYSSGWDAEVTLVNLYTRVTENRAGYFSCSSPCVPENKSRSTRGCSAENGWVCKRRARYLLCKNVSHEQRRHNRAEQSRAEQSRAKQSSAAQHRKSWYAFGSSVQQCAAMCSNVQHAHGTFRNPEYSSSIHIYAASPSDNSAIMRRHRARSTWVVAKDGSKTVLVREQENKTMVVVVVVVMVIVVMVVGIEETRERN
ncbi:hypothetical protein M0804_000421 [Polistes exclamans]|nr:hypothetical protein M0804_000421 [Polistes exclamans]